MKVIARETIAYIKTPSSSCLYLKQVYDIPHNFVQIQGFGIFSGSNTEPVGGEPFQNSVFVEEVVPVDARELASEVDQGWHLVHPVLLRVSG